MVEIRLSTWSIKTRCFCLVEFGLYLFLEKKGKGILNLSKTAKIIIVAGVIFLAYFVFDSINRENTRKERLNVIDDHFKKPFKIEEELKEQYDEDFLIEMDNDFYMVTVKDNKVVKTVKQ